MKRKNLTSSQSGLDFAEIVNKQQHTELARVEQNRYEATLGDVFARIFKRSVQESGETDMYEIYDKSYAKYFGRYVRELRGEKSLSDEKAIKLLNDDLIKNVGGMFVNDLKKTRNIHSAYVTFRNACASVEIQLAKECGVDNFYDLDYSNVPQKRKTFEDFCKWQEEKETIFKELAGVQEEIDIYVANLSPAENIGQTGEVFILTAGVVLAGVGTGVTATALTAYLSKAFQKEKKLGIAGVSALTIALVGSSFGFGVMISALAGKCDTAYADALNEIATKYGYESGTQMVQTIIKRANYAYLTPEEAVGLSEIVARRNAESIAQYYGYSDLNGAISALYAHSKAEMFDKGEIVANINEERVRCYEFIAQMNGFSSYKQMSNYMMRSIKGDTGNFSGIWEDYEYTNSAATTISHLLAGADSMYDERVFAIQNGADQQEWTVFDNSRYAQIAEDIQAYGNAQISGLKYEIENADGRIFYSPKVEQIFAGNEALDLAEDYGYDTIVSNAHKGKVWYSDEWINEVTEEGHCMDYNNPQTISANLGDTADTAIDLAGGAGLMGVAILGMCSRSYLQILNAFRQKRTNDKVKNAEQIAEQIAMESEPVSSPDAKTDSQLSKN